MNVGVVLGFALAGAVVYFGVLGPAARPAIFLDSHALILVLGGTLASALVAFPLKQFNNLFNFVILGALMPSKKSHVRALEHLMILAPRPDLASIDESVRKEMHHYLIEGYLLSLRGDLTTAEYKMILQGRHQRAKERYGMDYKVLNAIAKFPPAFGLLGATAGMIAMMTNLGAAGKDAIGPSMAIALVATFWGIALANLVLLPLADHAMRLNHEDAQLRLMISTGLVLIHEQVRPQVLLEHLIGFLPVTERSNPRFSQLLARAKAQMNGTQLLRVAGDGE